MISLVFIYLSKLTKINQHTVNGPLLVLTNSKLSVKSLGKLASHVNEIGCAQFIPSMSLRTSHVSNQAVAYHSFNSMKPD